MRACPHLTPFVIDYLEIISNKKNDRKIKIVRIFLHQILLSCNKFTLEYIYVLINDFYF